MNLVFMGTPDFAVPALEALIAAGHRLLAVYTQAPKPAGRGQKEQVSPVHRAARRHGIPVRTPKTLRDPAAAPELRSLGADLAIVAAYGLILPQAILDAPRLGCWNIHASLLPRWRGAAPIQRAIEAGDAETGITLMRMEAGLDTGPMLVKSALPIGARETAGALHDRLAVLGAQLVVEGLRRLEAGALPATPQPADGVTYAKKIEKSEARLDWSQPAPVLERRIRAFNPFPGAWFEIGGERVKALLAEVVPAGGPPGTVLNAALTVACGTGALRLLDVQRAGRAPMRAEDFLRGFPVPPGTRLA